MSSECVCVSFLLRCTPALVFKQQQAVRGAHLQVRDSSVETAGRKEEKKGKDGSKEGRKEGRRCICHIKVTVYTKQDPFHSAAVDTANDLR